MPSGLTDVTEIVTGLGTLPASLDSSLAHRPPQLLNVPAVAWERLVGLHAPGPLRRLVSHGVRKWTRVLSAEEGLRGRAPVRVEWKGPHRPPGDDVIPADLRIDHVFLVSCKYLSKVLLNPGPPRLFDRLLVGDERSTVNWFHETAAKEFQTLYDAARVHTGLASLPEVGATMTRPDQRALKSALSTRDWPAQLGGLWADLCRAVASESAGRWRAAMTSPRDRLRLLWRMLRVTTAAYFVLGTDRTAHLRLRVDSAWDWLQAYELRALEVAPRDAGQPEVGWNAYIRRRSDRAEAVIQGHVEIRWSHGRFFGSPESKVYLDTPHADVPGYNALDLARTG